MGPCHLHHRFLPTKLTTTDDWRLTLVGGPGTGAYEQAELISKDWDIVHISTTELLRAEQAREGSKYGGTISKFMAEGELVPLEIVVGLLLRKMQYHITRGKYCFVIDGFPRKTEQARAFENNVLSDILSCGFFPIYANEEVVEPEIVLALDAPEGVLVKRLKEKGGEKVNQAGILQVLETSKKDVDPLVEYYTKRHKVQMIPCDDTNEGAPQDTEI